MSTQFNEHDHERITQVIHDLSAHKLIDEAESIDALDLLEAYECWTPFTELIQAMIKDPKRRKLIYYVRLAKMQNQYVEDIFSAAETCSKAVSDLKLNFERFTQVLREVLSQDDWSAEAVILQSVSGKFQNLKDSQKLSNKIISPKSTPKDSTLQSRSR